MSTGKGLIRSLNRRGTRADKSPAVARKGAQIREPALCERCGAIYARKTWRRSGRVTQAILQQAAWTVCPGCQQSSAGQYFGRVLLRGTYVAENPKALRERIQNVAARAELTQPQRQLISVTPTRDGLEVLATSQKLAHRIVHELKKAFRGRAAYHWSDRDGTLTATWERDA